MYSKRALLLISLLLAQIKVRAQDCRVRGQRCVDDEQCCGGCCIDGECVDTYRSCLDPYDVCRGHVCIGDEVCMVYTPPDCPGCETIPVCQELELA